MHYQPGDLTAQQRDASAPAPRERTTYYAQSMDEDRQRFLDSFPCPQSQPWTTRVAPSPTPHPFFRDCHTAGIRVPSASRRFQPLSSISVPRGETPVLGGWDARGPLLTQKRKCYCLAITAFKAGRTRPPGRLESAFAPLMSHAAALFRWGLSRRRNVAGKSNCTPSTTPCGVTGSYRPKKSPLYPTTNEGRDWWNGPSDFRQGQTCRGRPRPHGASRVRGMTF